MSNAWLLISSSTNDFQLEAHQWLPKASPESLVTDLGEVPKVMHVICFKQTNKLTTVPCILPGTLFPVVRVTVTSEVIIVLASKESIAHTRTVPTSSDTVISVDKDTVAAVGMERWIK